MDEAKQRLPLDSDTERTTMTDYLYPCGFAAIGFKINANEHVGRSENYFSTETVMLKAGVIYRHAFIPDIPIRLDLIVATGPCVLSRISIGMDRIPTGMNARIVSVRRAVTWGEQVAIEFMCKPEIFMLRQYNASTSTTW